MKMRGGRMLMLILAAGCFSCLSPGTSAEEYYSLGQAYLELGRYEEAERWFNRARMADKTRTASEYNLGRIAFERGRYQEAAEIFDKILAQDPENVTALRAAAYTRIRTGEFIKAQLLYDRVLALVPESADDGYNYALVLYAMNQYDRAEAVLRKYTFALDENADALLLLARCEGKQDKPEAADRYGQWLKTNSNPAVRYEYARALEKLSYYARALEEYRSALNAFTSDTEDLRRCDIRFALARVLLVADPEGEEGMNELRSAVAEGFSDKEALRALLPAEGLSEDRRREIQGIIDQTG
ncbi:MAG: tetratricopeptide repeat protein [Treponema sp.]|jgi:tetratricopeptide (TPR) repeat protein|nr:tetratricopeptide repeat protein [Treponema sp.]